MNATIQKIIDDTIAATPDLAQQLHLLEELDAGRDELWTDDARALDAAGVSIVDYRVALQRRLVDEIEATPLVAEAMALAAVEDEDQVVGVDELDRAVIRDSEDPESYLLRDRVVVNAGGIKYIW